LDAAAAGLGAEVPAGAGLGWDDDE